MSFYDRVFPRWRPPGSLRPTRAPSSSALRITWLGTAAHVLETPRATVLIDPFVTRTPLHRLAGKIEPDDDAILRWIPKEVDAILCGHSHYDHLLDAPRIAKITGATIVGSRSTAAFARAAGVAEDRIVTIPHRGGTFAIEDVEVRFVPSLHGRIFLGRVPFPGEVTRPPRVPSRVWHYRMGGAYGLLVRAAGVRVYHNGSADLVDAELAGARADVLLVGLAGRRATRDYLGRLARALSPAVVIPTHHDAFFAPLERGLHLLPNIDLDGFTREMHAELPLATILAPDYGERVLVEAGDARAAGIARV